MNSEVLLPIVLRSTSIIPGNFAVNVDVHKSLDLAEKNIRSTSTIGYWMSLVKEMRSDLDSAGNNNDLLVYATSLGGMSARATVDAYDLSVDTGEHYRYTMQGFINQILKNPDITNPYPIMLWRQGESDNEDISETEVEYNKWLSENRALFGYDVPVVIIPPLWSRTDIIALQNKIISENNHVISGFGADLDDFQAETVSQHNATGVGTTIDPSDSATFTIDGLHFNYAVLIQDGIIAAPALESLGSGYAY